ncbi:hypothetical protein [Rhizobium phaseoli]|uniref:hypothetical protein n=1 Tax=Rhizobium phaseoli TaxID=396 RepID=UPI0012377188|nr:hypothetical protein [Rhizobium phaseoli]
MDTTKIPLCGEDNWRWLSEASSFESKMHCVREEQEAATWLYDVINRSGDKKSLTNLFLLQATAGSNLSVLEVAAALGHSNTQIQPASISRTSWPPPLVNRDAAGPRAESPSGTPSYESWDNWGGQAPQFLFDQARAIYFWDQTVKGSPIQWPVPDLLEPAWPTGRMHDHTTYFVGNSLSLDGSFSATFRPDSEAFEGPFFLLAVNRLTVEQSATEEKVGIIDAVDFYAKPVLTVYSTNEFVPAAIAASNISIGERLATRSLRIAAAFGLNQSDGTCPITITVLRFATKHVDRANPNSQELLDLTRSAACLQEILKKWRALVTFELARNPGGALQPDIFAAFNQAGRQRGYVTTDLRRSNAIFDLHVLEQWQLAAAERLSSTLSTLRLGSDRVKIARLLREISAFGGQLLTDPTSTTSSRLKGVLNDLLAVRNELGSLHFVIPGEDFDESPVLQNATLIGSAASLQTWLVPNSLRLLPAGGGFTDTKFATVWVDGGDSGDRNVYLNFLAEFTCSDDMKLAARKALEARGLEFSGLVRDARFTLRQSQARDWTIVDAVQLDHSVFSFTVRTTEDYFSVLLEQLNRAPGVPVKIDWQLAGLQLSGNSVPPIVATLGLYGLRMDAAIEFSRDKVTNTADVPLSIIAVGNDVSSVVLQPALEIAPRASAAVPTSVKASAVWVHAVFDPNGKLPAKEKLRFVDQNWKRYTLLVRNLSDEYKGEKVQSATVRLEILDDVHNPVIPKMEVVLGRFGSADATKALNVLLPAGFRVRYSSTYRTVSGSLEGASGEAETATIEVRVHE